MSDDRRSFFDAICARPDEDLPRLVYADWLEEHGETARAEFIRCQCSAAKLDRFDEDRESLDTRADDLLRDHEGRWFVPPAGHSWRSERGFVNDVSLPLDDFPAAVEVARLHPVTRWSLKCRNADAATVSAGSREAANSPHLEGVRELELRGPFRGTLPVLLGSPYLRRLEGLRAVNWVLDSADWRSLATCRAAVGLRLLDIREFGELWANDLLAFASAHGATLHRLRLATLTPRPDSSAVVAAVSRFPALTDLSLMMVLSGSEVAALIETLPPDLRRLEIDYFDETGAEALFAWPGLRRLDSLELCGFRGQLDCARLARRLDGARIRELTLDCDHRDTRALGRYNLGCLRELDLFVRNGEDWSALFAAPWFGKLRRLTLSGILTEEIVDVLASSPGARGLRCLSLTHYTGSVLGWRRLIRSRHLSALNELSLDRGLTVTEAVALTTPPALPNLRRLTIRIDTEPEATSILRRRWPGSQLRFPGLYGGEAE